MRHKKVPSGTAIAADKVWVTRTEFAHFCRCPYAFSMLQSSLVTPDAADAAVAKRETMFPHAVRRLFWKRRWTINWGPRGTVYRNEALRISGKPHGVDESGGAMIPVAVFDLPTMPRFTEDDIEWHAHKLTWRDRWSLAFSWLLLLPYRTARATFPHGHIVRLAGYPKIEALELDVSLDAEVATIESVIEVVRRAKKSVSPWPCRDCAICQDRDEQSRKVAREAKALSLVRGISLRQGIILEGAGIRTYEDLLAADSQSLAQIGVPLSRIEPWKAQAFVVATQRSHVKKPLPIDPERMLIFDVEHVSESWTDIPTVWLIGVRIVRDGQTQEHLLWAETPADEWRNLWRLAVLFKANRDLPVVTWNGTSSDLRILREAAGRWRAVGKRLPFDWLNEVEERHLDLLRFVRDNVRLPVTRLGLKEVARFFGLPHDEVSVRVPKYFGDGFEDETIDDGRAASDMRVRYSYGLPSRDRPAIQRALIVYNRQDLAFVAEIAKKLKAVPTTP